MEKRPYIYIKVRLCGCAGLLTLDSMKQDLVREQFEPASFGRHGDTRVANAQLSLKTDMRYKNGMYSHISL